MRIAVVACIMVLTAAAPAHVCRAAESPDSLDLSGFAPFDADVAPTEEPDRVMLASHAEAFTPLPTSSGVVRGIPDSSGRRFYLTSIVGGSFMVVSADNSPSSILTAGGAMGVAIERVNGRVRIEAEGRYRDPIEQTYLGFNRETPPHKLPGPPTPSDLIGTMQTRASGGWSAMANVWRDFEVTEQLDLYGGGGIGGAGFQTSFQHLDAPVPSPPVEKYNTQYAWQIGLGGIWNLNDRVALDVSYRLFGLGWTVTADDIAYGFLRTEILLSLRIYEPFRGLLR